MQNLNDLTIRIQDWAIDRDLDTADPTKQMLKLIEEVGELAQGMAKDNRKQVIDSIGDIYVVLTILSMQLNLRVDGCVRKAYEEIKDRQGKMVNGIYIKEEDL